MGPAAYNIKNIKHKVVHHKKNKSEQSTTAVCYCRTQQSHRRAASAPLSLWTKPNNTTFHCTFAPCRFTPSRDHESSRHISHYCRRTLKPHTAANILPSKPNRSHTRPHCTHLVKTKRNHLHALTINYRPGFFSRHPRPKNEPPSKSGCKEY